MTPTAYAMLPVAAALIVGAIHYALAGKQKTR
jgi:hypothetical protein